MKIYRQINYAFQNLLSSIFEHQPKFRGRFLFASNIAIAAFTLPLGSICEAKAFTPNVLVSTNFRLETVGLSAGVKSDGRTSQVSDNPDYAAPRATLDRLPTPAWSEPKRPVQYGPPDEQSPAAAMSAEERHLAKIERFNGKLEVVFQLANALDAIETISCSHKVGCSEGNPLFGNKPSTAKVLAIKSAVAGLHYYIYKKRNHIEPKGIRFFEIVSTVVYTAVAGVNISRTF